LTIPLETA